MFRRHRTWAELPPAIINTANRYARRHDIRTERPPSLQNTQCSWCRRVGCGRSKEARAACSSAGFSVDAAYCSLAVSLSGRWTKVPLPDQAGFVLPAFTTSRVPEMLIMHPFMLKQCPQRSPTVDRMANWRDPPSRGASKPFPCAVRTQ